MLGDVLNGILSLGGRIILAAILGVAISYRKQMDLYRQSVVHAHAFLAVAGAMFIMIIGDQIERAVGLIGVASIIRYRYSIRNPRDASTLIISLGVGMASGAGEALVAIVGTGFVLLISRLFDILPQAVPASMLHSQRETNFRIVTTDPQNTMERLETILSTSNVDYSLKSLERRQREIGPPQTIIEGTVRSNGDLQVSELTTEIVDEHVIQISWRESDPMVEAR
jgi:uncharacterized membrane protein YhiD involved in acid resistance